ncbi:MAG: diguanylate cyclase [Candidatus Wallbacteria bacterium]|nr:diguanylate cyclase [Candidatus Wallbacteria bacterium]
MLKKHFIQIFIVAAGFSVLTILLIYFSSLRSFFFTGLIITIMISAATLTISWLLCRNRNPFRELMTGISELAKGNLDYQFPVNQSHETLELATNINRMTLNLKQKLNTIITSNHELDLKNRAMQCLIQVNQAIINIPDMSQLLTKILEILAEAVNCEHASLMLLEGRSLKAKVVYWKDRIIEIEEWITFPVGEGIAGKSLELNEPLLVKDVEKSDYFIPYQKLNLNSGLRNMICLPLCVDNQPIGVINLLNKKNGFFNSDLKLGMALAGEVAVAFKNKQLYELSITDGLTGVFIRRYFQVRLNEEVFHAKRYKTDLSMIMLDIDHFKSFNDTYGHQVGDAVLRHVAKTTAGVIRKEIDFVARYGGEEFAVVCPGTPYEGALKLAERIRKTIEDNPLNHEKKPLKVTCSLGVSHLIREMGVERFIEIADQALYKAKETGRNRVC